MDAIDLARFQFAFVVSFHIIFPAFTIGLAFYLAVLEGLWLWKKEQRYLDLFKYWLKIFAVAFAMGVVSGIVMSYQFGTNWSVFSDKTGPVLGPLMGYEILSAFFLEAGFLGIMLFGLNKVGKKLHFFATLMVAFGTFFSAFWILSVNSWMHTPTGFDINATGQFIPLDWFEIIFNPSFPYRLIHMLMAAYLTTAFVVVSVGAFHLLKTNTSNTNSKTMISMGLWMIACIAPLQLIAGDFHGLNTLEYQPAKVAAMEGHYESKKGAPLILFGIPNDEEGRIDYEVSIPKLGSLILTHSLDGEIRGLNEWPRDERPPAEIIFWSFRLMVGIGLLMIAIGFASLWMRVKGILYSCRWYCRVLMFSGPIGFVAVIAGWVTT
ncbi:MAG: cytochrome ubiquinol oxidase subunit I, partial [Methylophilaceae bacterium]|nr:cytochrome ubiquinol oxidase subunit I [Methylophilaceae bacterium]